MIKILIKVLKILHFYLIRMRTPEGVRERLIQLNACRQFCQWAEGKTAKQVWEQCNRGDWLIWWAAMENQEIRSLTLAKARCSKLVIDLIKPLRSTTIGYTGPTRNPYINIMLPILEITKYI